MGIHELLTFLKSFNHEDEDNPEENRYVVSRAYFRDMSSCTLAIDISTVLYAQMNGARSAIINNSNFNIDMMIDENDVKKIFMRNMITYVESFLRIGCPLVIVFDGKAPELKDTVRAERRARRIKNLQELNKAMDEFNSTEPFDRTPAMVANLKKLMKMETHIPDEYVDEIRELFKLMGFSVVQAIGEAERVCATLCKEEYVRAVVSTDSDCLAHGCPIFISRIEKGNEINVIVLEDVLDALELDFEEFQELCIASGCDYNQIDGKCIPRCRIRKLYPMFKECGSYKEVVRKYGGKYDFSAVKMKECKKLFEDLPLSVLIEGKYSPPTNQIQSKLRKRLEEYDLCQHVGILLDLYAKFDTFKEDEDEE